MKSLRAFHLILAATPKGGIGLNQDLPWNLPTDLKHFNQVTTNVPVLKTSSSPITKQNAVIMGRRTWESIPEKYRPLPKRMNIIISSTIRESPSGVHVVSSLTEAIALCARPPHLTSIHAVFVIGGSSLYDEALSLHAPISRLLHSIYLTRVEKDYECDTFVPSMAESEGIWKERFHLASQEVVEEKSGDTIRFEHWQGMNQDELQYLNLVEQVLNRGVKKDDRTGVGTLSIFGNQMRFDLSDGRIPLLTTKRTFWKGICEELLWFLKGNTNAGYLQERGVRIWDGNATREFLDGRGLHHREPGDLGPVYGFQWRHWGASYKSCHDDYTDQGIDQIKNILNTLRTNPDDRRMILSAWNPAALHEMALPPCHIMAQFYVANNKLSCMMYQRSCDMGLGVPFNIVSYSLLTRLIAETVGLECGEFIHTLGDTHVYLNHVDALKVQLQRKPSPFPFLHILNSHDKIENYSAQDFIIVDYTPQESIKMEMAV